eukprot:Skav204085  [mRNA]  locus=scaffold3129:298618:301389:- [translate_table: standard]
MAWPCQLLRPQRRNGVPSAVVGSEQQACTVRTGATDSEAIALSLQLLDHFVLGSVVRQPLVLHRLVCSEASFFRGQ